LTVQKLGSKLPVQGPAMLLFGLGKPQRTTWGACRPCEYSAGKVQLKEMKNELIINHGNPSHENKIYECKIVIDHPTNKQDSILHSVDRLKWKTK